MMKKPDFLHIDADLHFEKYWCGRGQKWVWLLWSQDTESGCISRRNQWSKLITLIIFALCWSEMGVPF